MRILLMLLLLYGTCYAQEVNEKYSYKDLSEQNFTKVDPKEFNNTTIVGSAFGKTWTPEAKVFPNGMTGVVFKNCNLDNCYVPPGNTLEGTTTNKHILPQNDWEDWVVEKNIFQQWVPKEPMNKEQYLKANKSIAPKDIPNNKWSAEERERFMEDLRDATSISTN